LPQQKPEHHEHFTILIDALIERNEVKKQAILLAKNKKSGFDYE